LLFRIAFGPLLDQQLVILALPREFARARYRCTKAIGNLGSRSIATADARTLHELGSPENVRFMRPQRSRICRVVCRVPLGHTIVIRCLLIVDRGNDAFVSKVALGWTVPAQSWRVAEAQPIHPGTSVNEHYSNNQQH